MMDKDYAAYCIIGASIGTLLVAVATFNIYIIAFAALVCLASLFLYRFGDIVEALVIKRTSVVQVLCGFELEGEREAAVRRTGRGFTATSAAVLEDAPTREISREGIERVIANSNAPFRLVVQVERLDMTKTLDSLKTRRRMREIELSKARIEERDGAPERGSVIERELELIEGEIREIGSGAMPLKATIYLITTAVAESRFGAVERATSQARELSGEFSAVLGATFGQVSGAALVRLLATDSVNGA